MNCGVSEHEATCLCDVVITNPVEVNFGFTDVKHADVVARALGYKGGAHADLADFLEALGAAHDATVKVAAMGSDDWLADIISSGLKSKVREQLLAGESIVDLPVILDEPFMRIVAAITQGVPSMFWTWDEPKWARFESRLNEEEYANVGELVREFGGSTTATARLVAFYGKKNTLDRKRDQFQRLVDLRRQHPTAKPAKMRALCAQAGDTWSQSGMSRAVRKADEAIAKQRSTAA